MNLLKCPKFPIAELTSQKVEHGTVLMEAEAKFRSLVEESIAGVYIIQDGIFAYANPYFCEIFGYPQEELVGIACMELVVIEDKRVVEDNIEKRSSGHNVRYQMRGIKKDKSIIYIEVHETQTDYNGKKAIIGTAHDITERKQAEQALRESEERYRRLLELSPEPTVVYSDDSILYINAAGIKLVGVSSKDEVVGRKIWDFIHPDSHDDVRKRNSQITQRFDFMEEKIIRLDGQVLDVEVSGITITFEGKKAWIVVIRDITEYKKTAEFLRKSDKLAIVGQLAAGVAHEVRNPLTVLKGFIQLLSKGSQDGEGYFALMLSEVERIEEITSEFLVFARPHIVRFEKRDIN
ncbi:MAG: PAS domain S-box protein, partial [Thermincolia bacterium]